MEMAKRRRKNRNGIRKLTFEQLEFRRVLVSGPWILSITPTELRNAEYDHVDVSFNSDINAATFSPIDVTLISPAGSVNIISVTQLAPASFRLNFTPLTVRGDYRVVIGSDILDLAGNAMNQDKDGVNGEATEDQFNASLRLIVADVILSSTTTINESNTLYNGKNILIDGATVAIDGPHNFNSVHMINGGVLTHTANSTSSTYKLDLTVVEQVIIDATSSIDVSGKGYLAGRTTGNTMVGGATGDSGASHGGYGSPQSGSTNRIYGDYADPDDWGSGGGRYYPGGGLVRVAANSLVLDGQIVADGVGYVASGAGAGGSIYVSVATVQGTGAIRAAGGPSTYTGEGAGGGGRVAVYSRDFGNFDTHRITAPGGNAGTGPGGAGTVYVVNGPSLTHVRQHTPSGIPTGFVGSGNGYINHAIDFPLLSFNRPINLSTFSSSTIEITGQMGRVTPTGMTLVGDRTYRVDLPFALSENGTYHFKLLPSLKDEEGFFLDQDADGIPGEPLDDIYAFDLTVDTSPPRITLHNPAGDIAGTINSTDLYFSEAIEKATFTASDITIIRPDATNVPVGSITEVGFNRFRIAFAAQTLVGLYHVKIGPDVRDKAGNKLDQDRDGTFGETTDDIYDATFNLVPVDLGLSNLVVGASPLWAGEPVSVSWNGTNRTGAVLVGNWIDAVYLSADDKWDINDLRLTTVEHTGGLAEGGTYTASTTINVPGKSPGNYRILVRADVANQERETNEADNLIASSVIPLDVHPLVTDGTTVNGTLTTADRGDYYKIVLASGDSLKLKLHSSTAGSQTELYASYAGLPSRMAFDQRSATTGTDQGISLKAIHGGGVYYVFVYGNQIPGTLPYTITAERAPFFVTSMTPARHGIGTPATVTITGVGFDENSTLAFYNGQGFNQFVPVNFISTTTLTAVVNLDTVTLGTFSVRVTKDGTSVELANAYQLIAAAPAKLETNLVVPGSVSPGFPIKQTLWVEYRNSGNVAMAAPLLQVSADGNSLLTTDENLANTVQTLRTIPNGLGGSVQLLGIGSSATPGLLQPGESGRLPVYYVGLSQDLGRDQVNFSLGSLSALDTTEKVAYVEGPHERIPFERPATGVRVINPSLPVEPLRVVRSNATSNRVIFDTGGSGGGGGGGGGSTINPANVFEEYLMIDWSELMAARPASILADAWKTILYNVRDHYLDGPLGSDLWADYVTRMSKNANYLAAVGQTTSSVAALWGFEVAGASAALNPVRYLAGAVDASVAAPGLPLTFSRVYGQDIVSRFRTGTMGRGWTHNWDIRWSASDNGDITLHGPGGVDRFFTKNKNGTYLATPGDYGQLTLAGGVFKLVETDKTLWQFRTDGVLDFVADTNGNRITLSYTDGLPTTLTHSNGRQLLLAYSGNVGTAKLLSQINDTMGSGTADDRITTYEYDAARQHLLRVVAPGNRVTQYEYAAVTQLPFDVLNSKAQLVNLGSFADPRSHALLSVTHVDGTHDYFAYDNQGRLTETKQDANTERVTFNYVSAGGVKVVDGTGRDTLLNFGLGGQLAQVRDADGRIVEFGYDAKFQFSQLGGPGGEQYDYAYDATGNLTGIRDALNLQTSFSYETSFNRLSGFTDARGNGIDYQYDSRGNLTRITYEDLTHEDFTYDSIGNVISATNRRGQVVAYVYNPAGQVTSKDYVATPGIDFTYQYDVAGNLIQASDAGGTTGMSYEAQTDRLTRIDYPGGKSFTFVYDTAGRRTRRTDQDGNIENYAYDSIGRLDRMTDGASNLIVDYDYDAAGRLSKKTLGNGVYTTYLYDKAGNVKNLANFKPDNTVLSRYDYEYDVSGRRTSMTTLTGRFDYGYDALGQLVSVRHPDGHVVVYDYDEAGNRRQVIDDGTSTEYTTNNLNQYTQVGGVTYAFDADGNLISQTENGVTTTYAYNIENRLIGVTNPTDTWIYTYDALGNRVASTQNGQTTRYVIDPTGLGNVAAEYDGSGNLIARYDHGYGLLSRNDGTDTAFYTFQAIGHTSELTGIGGTVLNSYAYDPFGVSLGKTETVANPFEYVGEFGVMNEGNGLEFMRGRNYVNVDGRFCSMDPAGIAGGLHVYTYASNSPASFMDPIGLRSFSVGFGGHILAYGASLRYAGTPSGNELSLDFDLTVGTLWDFGVDFEYNWGEPKTAISLGLGAEAGVGVGFDDSLRPVSLEVGIGAGVSIPVMITKPGLSIPVPELKLPPWLLPLGLPNYLTLQFLSWLARSRDPNDKLAPAGVGDTAFVVADRSLAYTVRFENQPDATAPAREIIVTDILDADLDLDSFELTEIAFANQRISVSAGLSHFETTVAMIAVATPVRVEVTADLDRDTRQLTLVLRAVDPVTGWSPEDPLVGFLYPNDVTGRGQGSVSYRIKPKTGLPSGTEITNRAKIYFDTNDPIDTPLVHNTLDAAGPTSQVAALPATTTSPTFDVTWSGQDDASGSGVASYDLYVSRDGGIYAIYVAGTSLTSFDFTFEPNHTYSFYTVATDNVGHRQSTPAVAQASILILPLTWTNPSVSTDVDADGSVSPLDVLVLINRINLGLSSDVLPAPSADFRPAPYFDVDGDGRLTPLDVLIVINFINADRSNGEGESEITLNTNRSIPIAATDFSGWVAGRPPSVSELSKNRVQDQVALAIGRERSNSLTQSAPFALPVPFIRGNRLVGNAYAKRTRLEQTSEIDEGLLDILASDIQPHFHRTVGQALV